jgi:hypothetical protein
MSEASLDVESLASKLAAALGRKRPAVSEEDDDGRGPPRTVPYHRFKAELEARKALQAEVVSIKGMVEDLQKGHATQLEEVKAAAAEGVTKIQARHAEDMGLMEAGFRSSTDRQALRMVWDGLPKSERGKSPGEWWGTVVEAHKAHQADPEKAAAPKVATPLTPYLPAPEAKTKPPPGGGNRGGNGWGGPPAGPSQRTGGDGIESAPVDQGLDAFLAALPSG